MQRQKINIYQVLPRLFGNGVKQNKPNGSIEENGCGKLNDFTPHVLNEIKKLGFSHIWYTGVIEHASLTDYSQQGIAPNNASVVKGVAGSPYAIRDYYDISPDLAVDIPNRLQEFEALVERTHQANLKVIIDFVPNHVARQYASDSKPAGVVDLGAKDEVNSAFSPQNNFYYIPNQPFQSPNVKEEYLENPAKVTGNDCFSATPSINDWYETVKLNYGVNYQNGGSTHFEPIPNTWLKMCDILLYWASKNVDGFRCDMAEMVPVAFWNWAIAKVKAAYPNIVFIAEIYNTQRYEEFIRVGGFDYLYDKMGFYDTVRAVIEGHQLASAITQSWQQNDKVLLHLLYFIENHDEQRASSDFFAGDARKAFPGMALATVMLPNATMLYFGQELGEKGMDSEGFSGRDGRTTIFDYWSLPLFQHWFDEGRCSLAQLPADALELRNYHQKILNLSLSHPALEKGYFYDLSWFNPDINPFCFPLVRYWEGRVLLILINFSGEQKDIMVRIPSMGFDLYGIKHDQWLKGIDLMGDHRNISFAVQNATHGGVGVILNAYGVAVYELK